MRLKLVVFCSDAEECWVKIADALKDVPLEAGSQTSSKKFVDAYMMGQMRRECVYTLPPPYSQKMQN